MNLDIITRELRARFKISEYMELFYFVARNKKDIIYFKHDDDDDDGDDD